MAESDVDSAQLEAILRSLGLIPLGYTGTVVVSASTSSGSGEVTINV